MSLQEYKTVLVLKMYFLEGNGSHDNKQKTQKTFSRYAVCTNLTIAIPFFLQ
jgi:hypothetical protein